MNAQEFNREIWERQLFKAESKFKDSEVCQSTSFLINWHKGELTELLYLLLKQRQYFTFTSDIHRVKENVRGATPFPLSTVLLAHKISISQNVQ